MSDETRHSLNHGQEGAQGANEAIKEIQRELKRAHEELGYLKTFCHRLLGILKLQFRLNDEELNGLVEQAEVAQAQFEDKPGQKAAPLCSFCHRSLQADSAACIYCGRQRV